MALFRKNLRQRRLEVRRTASSGPSLFSRLIRRPGVIGSLAIALVFYLVAALLMIYPPNPLGYRQGQYIPHDVTARVKFRVLDEELLEEAMEQAASSTPATFRLNEPLIFEILSTLEKAPARLESAQSVKKVDTEILQQLGMARPSATTRPRDESPTTQPTTQPAVPPKTQKTYDAWVELADSENRATLEAILSNLRPLLTRLYIFRPDRPGEQQDRSTRTMILTDGQSEVVQKVMDMIGQDEVDKIRQRIAPAVRLFPPAVRDSVEHYLLGKLLSEPVYRYEEGQTEQDKVAAVTAIRANPPETVFKHYAAGNVLVQRSESPLRSESRTTGLSENNLQLLAEEQQAYLAMQRQEHPWAASARLTAEALIVLLLTAVLCAYIAQYQGQLIADHPKAISLALLLLVMLALTKLLIQLLGLNPFSAMLSVTMGGIVLAIAFDQRFALAVGAMLAAMIIYQIRGSFELLIVALGGLFVCVFLLREIRTRSKLIGVSALTAVLVFLSVWAVKLQTGSPWHFIRVDSLWAAGAVLLAGLIVQGLLPLIERVFNVATGSTLLEWCDASKPLLKRLAMDSPGTYNHSLQLGAMCEAAAEAIGGRGLLARVGAYYHDIGKINKPDYFAENIIAGQDNKHSRLSPAMSLLIIINHVKDGLEMARRYGLPTQLHEFIATHHGTTLVQYFYHTAKEQSDSGQGDAPEESQFRYPGPKPQSREAAILMLADASESSVRAMSEPTPARIRNQVHKMVNVRLEDGQLDECELTLREVHQIEESFVKSLCGMYHGRIAYPGSRKEGESKESSEARGVSPASRPSSQTQAAGLQNPSNAAVSN